MDYCLTVAAMVVLAPLLLLIAVAIQLDSAGPVIFRQRRVGLAGRVFDMYKFRSMYRDADQSAHQAHVLAFAEGKFSAADGVKMKHDPRVTRVGRLLRKSSLDELPQLFNVLLGHMTLVGPRPVPIYEADLYNLWHSERLSVLPGITGLWQVTARCRVSFDEQIRLDIRYIRNYSLWLDVKILLKTIPAVISKSGAG
jgi:lipopolysaccharide/colanic/teichoic acid biosynthesis glycosyltransferase